MVKPATLLSTRSAAKLQNKVNIFVARCTVALVWENSQLVQILLQEYSYSLLSATSSRNLQQPD